jgi:hypothetical protein
LELERCLAVTNPQQAVSRGHHWALCGGELGMEGWCERKTL